MSILIEVDHRLATTPQGIVTHSDIRAVTNNIEEWFDTPSGSLCGKPSWGNNLAQFKHEPTDDNTEVGIQMAILNKLPREVRGAEIMAIRVEYKEFDIFIIKLMLPSGEYLREQAV